MLLSDLFGIGDVAKITADRERNLHHMTRHLTSACRSRVRALGAAFAIVMVLGGTAACSSDSDSKSADKSSSETDSKPDSATESKSGSDQGLPDGYPDDVPLPEFANADTVRSGDDGSDYWVLMLTIDPTLEESGDDLMAAYSSQLEDEGYEVDDSGNSSFEAENEKWSLNYHSSMDGTLTVGTGPN